MPYGAVIKNGADEIQVDGINGFPVYCVQDEETLNVYKATDPPYKAAIKHVDNTTGCAFHSLHTTKYTNFAYLAAQAGDYYLAAMWSNSSANPINVDLIYFEDSVIAMTDKYGMAIWDKDGAMIFSSSNRYMFVEGAQTFSFSLAEAQAGTVKTLTVKDNSNYFLCGPPAFWFDSGNAGNGYISTWYPMGIKKGAISTQVSCKAYTALAFSDPDPVTQSNWPDWDKYLIEIRAGN